MRRRVGVFLILAAALPAAILSAQVVRESETQSIAGVLVGGGALSATTQPTAEWTFMSGGGEVLFASLDAEIYKKQSAHEGGAGGGCGEEAEGGCSGEDEGDCSGETGGGCSGEDEGGCSGEDEGGCSGETGGGCSGEGGPGLFFIEVLDSTQTVLCRAERPAPPPGWQRDPRLACVLERVGGQATYTLRVGLKEREHGGFPDGTHPFLLNISLRRLAPTSVNIQEAVAQSKSRF